MLRLRPSTPAGGLTVFSMAIAATVAVAFASAGAAQTEAACPPEVRPPSPARIAEEMSKARDRGFLWRVSKANQTSYLYGTVHVGRQEWIFPGPLAMEAVRETEVVALELDVLDPDLIRRLQEGMTIKPDHQLPEGLSTRLRAQLKAACLPEQILDTTSPEMVAVTLTVTSARKSGLDPSYAVDVVYAGLARELEKPVSSLETPEVQLKALLGRTPEEVRAVVESALNDLESGVAASLMSRMAQVWADGRLGELENYGEWCQCLETPADRLTMRRLLDDRNPALAAGIDALHAAGKPVFAAVGSLHMIGPKGLPALLAERGYQVERVDFNRAD